MQASMNERTPPLPLHGVAALPQLGVIRAEGEDAARFLHGQLTQDFLLLGPDEARLAAFCSPKGRMLASFIGIKPTPQEILLVCQADVLQTTLKRLSMFVLRAKVRLSDASADYELRGLLGNALSSIAEEDRKTLACKDFGSGKLVFLHPAPSLSRALWIAPRGTPAPAGAELDPVLWQWAEVQSGVAWVSAAIADQFVPQMLNYESVGGVNFKKGCYPGQEVVARSQFRGVLKRRGYLVHGEVELRAGQEVFRAADPEQPCGLVAQAAPSPFGGFDAIASLQISAAEAADLHLGAADGPALSLRPLPYALLADV